MSSFRPKFYTVATKVFVVFVVVFVGIELGLLTWLGGRFQGRKREVGGGDPYRRVFSPAQVDQLVEFLRQIPPGDRTWTVVLQGGKTYRLPEGIFLQRLNRRQRVVITVEGGEKRAVWMTSSLPVMTLKNCENIVIRGVEFRVSGKGGEGGLVLVDSSSGIRFEDCDFVDSLKTGLVVRFSDRVEVISCRFLASRKDGLEVHQSEGLELRGSEFRGNRRYGLYAVGRGTFSGRVLGCRFEGSLVGIYGERTGLRVLGCKILGQERGKMLGTGVQLISSVGSKLGGRGEGLEVSDAGDGVVLEGGEVELSYSKVWGNRDNGVVLRGGGGKVRHRVYRARIWGNNVGIYVIGGSGELRENELRENLKAGICVDGEEARPRILSNKILKNKTYGVFFKRCGEGVRMEGNVIESNGHYGIFFDGSFSEVLREKLRSMKNTYRGNQYGKYPQ